MNPYWPKIRRMLTGLCSTAGHFNHYPSYYPLQRAFPMCLSWPCVSFAAFGFVTYPIICCLTEAVWSLIPEHLPVALFRKARDVLVAGQSSVRAGLSPTIQLIPFARCPCWTDDGGHERGRGASICELSERWTLTLNNPPLKQTKVLRVATLPGRLNQGWSYLSCRAMQVWQISPRSLQHCSALICPWRSAVGHGPSQLSSSASACVSP